MIRKHINIYCDTIEPDYNHLWLKPKTTVNASGKIIQSDGYDLFYHGAKEWKQLNGSGDNTSGTIETIEISDIDNLISKI
jgi:hypothetical protein